MALSQVFSPLSGGAGISITCNTSSSTRSALPTNIAVAQAICVTNVGVNYAFLVWGNSTIDATVAGLAISPGDQLILALGYGSGSSSPTHAAAISIDGATTLQISVGGLA